MLPISIPALSRRRALRRAVELDCAVHSPLWDGPAFYLATDVSPAGLWLRTDLALGVGEPLIVSFRPPRWPEWCWPVTAFGEVVRVSLRRRRSDRHAAGMGVRFSQIDEIARQEMALLLRGLPPPLPQRRPPAEHICSELPHALVLEDGSCYELCAEAELLTAGRSPAVAAHAGPAGPRARRRTRACRRALSLAQRPDRKHGRRAPKLRLVG
jgi:hypothetical protein